MPPFPRTLPLPADFLCPANSFTRFKACSAGSAYRPLKVGCRFSRKAATASSMSSLGIMRGVLLGDVGEPRADALVAALEEHLLRPLDGERREAGDRVGELLRLLEEGLPVVAEAGDESHLQGLFRGEVPARQGQFVGPAVADDVGEPLERPEIGDDPDPRLPDGEDRVPGGQPDVAGAERDPPPRRCTSRAPRR